jgi:hypothetical protein
MRLDRYLSLTSSKAVARQMFYCLAETEWVHKQRRFSKFQACATHVHFYNLQLIVCDLLQTDWCSSALASVLQIQSMEQCNVAAVALTL